MYAKYSKTQVYVTECWITQQTTKALLVKSSSGDARGSYKEEWLPKSQISAYEGDTKPHNFLTVIIMPEWLAVEKDLPYSYYHSIDLQVELSELEQIC